MNGSPIQASRRLPTKLQTPVRRPTTKRQPPGRVFGPCEALGEGGLGRVFVAHDEELHREVALKEIQPRHADEPTNRARFLREAEITGRLEHPNIVPIYALGRYKAGDLAKVDLSRITLQRAQYQSDYVNAQVNLRTAKISLLMLMNDHTPIDKFDIAGSYDFQDRLMPLEEFLKLRWILGPI